ncbi:MAG: response regulator, partial [Methylococcales bacterium]|nr:response regulator [Methylococcales bacterium]
MPPRIAHVDDDSDIRESVQRILFKHGYEVDSYLSMQEFIDSLQDETKKPDLAILDVMVESMDAGLTTYAKIHKQYPQIQT